MCKGFSPDFYYLCGHGTGAASLVYFFNLLGFPVTLWTGFDDGKALSVKYPATLHDGSGLKGLTVDRVIKGTRLSYGDNSQKVIQSIRDPIDTIVSSMNYYFGVSCCQFNGFTTDLSCFNTELLFNHIKEWLNFSCCFTSTYNGIQVNHNKIFYMEFNDILADTLHASLVDLCKFLEVSSPTLSTDEFKEKCKYKYNSFINRLWLYQKSCFCGNPQKGMILADIEITPKFLYEYGRNTWFTSTIIDEVKHNDIEYVLSIRNDLGGSSNAKSWNKQKRECIKKIIDIRLKKFELSLELYKKYAMTSEKLIELLRTRQKFYDNLRKKLEYEISMPLKYVPKKVQRWKNFHSMYSC